MIRSTTRDKSIRDRGYNVKSVRMWSILVWLVLWQIASVLLNQGILLVSPVTTVRRLIELMVKWEFLQTIFHTMVSIIIGFIAGTLIGITLAVIANWSRYVREFLQPLISVMKAIPVASFIILCLVFLSSKHLSIFIVFLMVLPIAYTNILQGIQNVDRNLLEMARVFEVPLVRRIRYLYMPAIWPFFYAQCKVGIGFSFKSGIAAEVIGMPDGTIGEKLYQAKIYLDTPDLFAWTVVIVIISIVFEKVFLYLVRLLYASITKQYGVKN